MPAAKRFTNARLITGTAQLHPENSASGNAKRWSCKGFCHSKGSPRRHLAVRAPLCTSASGQCLNVLMPQLQGNLSNQMSPGRDSGRQLRFETNGGSGMLELGKTRHGPKPRIGVSAREV